MLCGSAASIGEPASRRGFSSLIFVLLLSLPNKIIIAGASPLTNMGRAARVYAAACLYAEWPSAGDHSGRPHHQFALWPDHSCKPVSRGRRIMHTTIHDVERPRSPVWTLDRPPIVLRVHLIDFRRRHEPICTVKCRPGGRRRWSLGIRRSKQTEKSDDRY